MSDGTARPGYGRHNDAVEPGVETGPFIRKRSAFGRPAWSVTTHRDVESFLVHEDVTWRESMNGASFLLAVGLAAGTVAAAVWWWRRG